LGRKGQQLRVSQLAYGHERMTRVTGVGCALGALAAACCAVEESALVAAESATAVLTVAGELPAERAAAPGSFAVALADELLTLDGDTLRRRLAGPAVALVEG
jgi:hydroxyethylthiazole kinase